MRIWLYTLEAFVFHAYKRIVGAISKYKYYAVICICIHIMCIYRPIGHRGNIAAPTKRTVSPTISKAQRKRCDSGAMRGPPSRSGLLKNG